MFTRETYASFMAWIRIKISLHRKQKSPFFKEGELWWCSIGMNVGQEIFGKGGKFTRPVLIIKKITNYLFLALPLTTRHRQGTWYAETFVGGRQRWAILSQARVLDGRRLTKRIGALDEAPLEKIVEAFVAFCRRP